MQTPTLTGAQRAYMKDPEGFQTRMKHRAEELWLDGYTVEPTLETGVFAVNTPKQERHLVNVLTEDCTCAFQQKGDIPQVACKHLQGLPGLIDAQLAYYVTQAHQAHYRRDKKAKDGWDLAHAKLIGAWNKAQREIALKVEADACEMDTETYRRWKEENEARELYAA